MTDNVIDKMIDTASNIINPSEEILTDDEIIKYIQYSKKINPIFSVGARSRLKNYYNDVSNKAKNNPDSRPIDYRAAEALINISKATLLILG